MSLVPCSGDTKKYRSYKKQQKLGVHASQSENVTDEKKKKEMEQTAANVAKDNE